MCNELIEKLKWAQTEKLNILSGFDGFVDEIIHVVDKRIDKDNYIRVKTIEDYGHKILNAAGVSSNIECSCAKEDGWQRTYFCQWTPLFGR